MNKRTIQNKQNTQQTLRPNYPSQGSSLQNYSLQTKSPQNMSSAMSDFRQQYQQQGNANHNLAQRGSADVPTDLQIKINKVVEAIDGMYQFSGLRDTEKTNRYKAELTKGLYSIRDRIDESNLRNALNFFRTQGGKFPPSVPEFIQAVLGQHEEQTKPPELVWFDASKALPKHSAEQMAEFAKQGIASARAALKKQPKR
ncbi:hypothetical protein [Thalassotalea euphylliae]|uniref:Uncharacterized protein n=1 Tax=Thalassotalea euphylliae TaxID=1655234 RepID=A0A3E0UJT9_9GAMM|nr:hypothetical protein [Thalassotalea euphylliae]REL36883.1 hypothetical protein DXX92_17065 [Thalassotalea euphylliae]